MQHPFPVPQRRVVGGWSPGRWVAVRLASRPFRNPERGRLTPRNSRRSGSRSRRAPLAPGISTSRALGNAQPAEHPRSRSEVACPGGPVRRISSARWVTGGSAFAARLAAGGVEQPSRPTGPENVMLQAVAPNAALQWFPGVGWPIRSCAPLALGSWAVWSSTTSSTSYGRRLL